MHHSRVVVTGLGVVSPLGCTVEHVWNACCDGVTGIVKLTEPEYTKVPSRVAGRVPRVATKNGGDKISVAVPVHALFEEYAQFTKADLHRMSKTSAFALAAANESVRDSRLNLSSSVKQERAGVSIGVGMIDLTDVIETSNNLERGYSRVSPFFVSRILPNSPAGIVSLRHQLRGANLAPSTACATGLHAVIEAFMLIKHNYCDTMVCGGAEACISPLSLAGFARMRALSTHFNDEPSYSSRPFDSQRDGFVIAEGAAILVLESLHQALRRNAKIYAEILGFGLTADAHHMTSPPAGADGALRAMQLAVSDASLPLHQISYINAHATSTPQGDAAELKAIDRFVSESSAAFKSDDETRLRVHVTSTKGATGHLLGASGAIEALVTVMSCYSGIIPPTLNCSKIDIEHSDHIKVVQNKACAWEAPLHASGRRIALTNSFGFGGTNASLCIGQYVE